MTISSSRPIIPTCRTLVGEKAPVASGRRNRQPTLFFSPEWAEGGPTQDSSFAWLDDSRYYVNLNEQERRTWRLVLSAMSISAIAREEGVSRAAVYSRIQGNSKGQGGMIAKNFWVLVWWRLRNRLITPNPHD